MNQRGSQSNKARTIPLEVECLQRPLVKQFVHRTGSTAGGDGLRTKTVTSRDKSWSEIGIAVYRIGVGMYHSSFVVDNMEWHFWEGYGVECIPRYYDENQKAHVSINHVPFVTYVFVDILSYSPREVSQLCERLGASLFSQSSYNILTCNCNHFTDAILERLGYVSKMPKWINRLAVIGETLCDVLPFVRQAIDSLLSRSSLVDRNVPVSLLNVQAVIESKTLPRGCSYVETSRRRKENNLAVLPTQRDLSQMTLYLDNSKMKNHPLYPSGTTFPTS